MNLLDVLIIIILGYAIYTTIRKGFLRIVSEFVAFILAGYCAYRWHQSLATAFSSGAINDHSKIGGILAFIIIWVAIFALVNLMAFILLKILDKSFLSLILKPFNVLASIIMGLLKGILICLFVVIPLMIVALFSHPMASYVNHSFFVTRTQHLASGLANRLFPAPQAPPVKTTSRETKPQPQTKKNKPTKK